MGAYTTIDDPSAHFQTAIYTGTGSSHAIVNDGNSDLQPDWVWIKSRSASDQEHNAYDTNRGAGKRIIPSSGEAETDRDGVTAFNSDGFTTNYSDANTDGSTYVAWQWKANAGTTTSVSASGSILASTHQANATAGFSIVTWTGTGNAGTVSHGLGVAPKVVWVKNRDKNSQFAVYHKDIGATHYLALSDNDQVADYDGYWNDTHPTTSVFSVGSDNDVHGANTKRVLAYCFAEIPGYSRFGSYLGNANNSGPYIYTGFKPAMLIIKIANGHDESWHLWDNKRVLLGGNPNQAALSPDTNGADTGSSTPYNIDFLSNGFKIREDHDITNGDGDRYIYMAWAENPFVTSTGVPTTAI